jgi:hypothetical protein
LPRGSIPKKPPYPPEAGPKISGNTLCPFPLSFFKQNRPLLHFADFLECLLSHVLKNAIALISERMFSE